MRFTLLVSCVVFSVSPLLASAPARLTPVSPLSGLPLRFEANAGQWNPAVRFSARAAGYQLFLTDRETVLALDGRTVGMEFAGSSRDARFSGEAGMPGANYFVGNRTEWRTGVPQFGRVRRAGVYPGIDVVYYGHGNKLEYDFVLQPNADPSRIRIEFRGADRLSITPDGDLVLLSANSRFVQKRPAVYQSAADGTRRDVAAGYRLLDDRTVAVELGRYDRSRSLTIDPVLSYASLIGGGGSDSVTVVRQARNGNLYVAGYIQRNDLQGPETSFSASSKGGTDGFFAIIDPRRQGEASLVYFTYLGGSSDDRVNALAIDAFGVACLAGSTNSSDFPLAGTNVMSSIGSTDASDGFVTKLDPRLSGTDAVVYSTFIGGNLLDEANAVAVDGSGRIYVAGTTRSDNFPLTSNGYAGVRYGPQDGFLAKINPDSSTPLEYSTYFGSEKSDDVRALALGSNGLVYLAGNTQGEQFPQAGSQYRGTISGAMDAYLTVWNLSRSNEASLAYSTYLGGSSIDEVRAMALDASGKVLLTGYTMSDDFPLAGNAVRRNYAGAGDIWVARFNFTAQRSEMLEWSTYFGGDGGDVAYGIAPGPDGSVWITGYTLSTNFPATAAALQSAADGGVEVFLTNLDPGKAGGEGILYSTYLGSIGVNVAYSIAAGSDGTIYIGGQSAARQVQTTPSGYQTGFQGGLSDGFVLALGK
jgi:hypothetical protein